MTLTVLGIKRSNAVPRGADLPDCRCAYNELLLRVSGSRGAGLGSLMTGDEWSVSRCLVMRKFGMDGGRARRGFAVVKPLGWKHIRLVKRLKRPARSSQEKFALHELMPAVSFTLSTDDAIEN